MSHYRFRLGIIKNLIKPFFLTKKKSTDWFEFNKNKNDFCLKNSAFKLQYDKCQLNYTANNRLCMICFIAGNKPKK